MTKNILEILLAEIEIKQMFNLKQNICNYQQDYLYEETIKKIMIMKHAHQKNMIDEIFLSEMKLKKKAMNDDKNFFEAKKNNYLVNKEKKLMQSCHFDYQETAQTAVKKTAMKKAKEITRKTNQKKFKVSE